MITLHPCSFFDKRILEMFHLSNKQHNRIVPLLQNQ